MIRQCRSRRCLTPFGLWLRQYPGSDGDVNLDDTGVNYVWRNYNTGWWMIFEERQWNGRAANGRCGLFSELDSALRNADPNYRGFHAIVFECTSPEDGRIWLDGKEITKEQLLGFLRFGYINTHWPSGQCTTRPCKDKTRSTPFGLWLRRQPEIDSGIGYDATDIDYIWRNCNTGHYMILEEKQYLGRLTNSQCELFGILSAAIRRADPMYCGFHVIIFECTSPEDGRIWLDGKEISKERLLWFLRFKDSEH